MPPITRLVLITIIACLLLPGCILQSPIPIGPVTESSYSDDMLDTWVMYHDRKFIYRIEKEDNHQVRVSELKDTDKTVAVVNLGHFTSLGGLDYFSYKSLGDKKQDHYYLIRYDRPCPNIIRISIPNPEMIDRDIKSGYIKGRIHQDFFTNRYIEEAQAGLQQYLINHQDELFVLHHDLVRQSAIDSLSTDCQGKIGPPPWAGRKQG